MELKQCRYPTCLKSKLQRFGLCNKHRKWVEKGYMTQDLVMLKDPKEKANYEGIRCKVNECENSAKKRGMCLSHYAAVVVRKTLTETGDSINRVRSAPYSPDFGCVICGETGKIVKGFCKKHYAQFSSGLIDFDGTRLREKRVIRYEPWMQCKVVNCTRKPRVRGWCNTHYLSFDKGIYNAKGVRIKAAAFVNQGKPCSTEDCSKPAHCKGLCKLHYARKQTGYLGPAGYKNVGKMCSTLGCNKPAHSLTKCDTHYRRLHAKNKIEQRNRESSDLRSQGQQVQNNSPLHIPLRSTQQ